MNPKLTERKRALNLRSISERKFMCELTLDGLSKPSRINSDNHLRSFHSASGVFIYIPRQDIHLDIDRIALLLIPQRRDILGEGDEIHGKIGFSAEGGPTSGGETKWTFTHNPFSAPKIEFMKDLMEGKNTEKILTTQYDIVLNGWEIGGGSVRNHNPEALEKVFETMGYKKEEIREKFGHMMEAFKFGMPPHGGLGSGFDRVIALLLNEPNIREVIAFPKTGDGRDLMMDAPDEISPEQMKELSIKITEKKLVKKIKRIKKIRHTA